MDPFEIKELIKAADEATTVPELRKVLITLLQKLWVARRIELARERRR